MHFPSGRMQHTQRNRCMACMLVTQSKNRNMQHMHAKTTHAIDSMFVYIAFFCVRILCPLRCIWQLGNRPLNPFLHSDVSTFGLHQPATAKFLFYDGWAVCEIRRSTLVQDIIIEASALNKWTYYKGRSWCQCQQARVWWVDVPISWKYVR